MKMKFYLYILLSTMSTPMLGQKPAIDTGVLGKWPKVAEVGISDDGHYYYYLLDDKLHDRTLLTVSSDIKGLDTQKIPGARTGLSFTSDSRWGLFMNGHDSLGILNLAATTTAYYSGIKSFKVSSNRKLPCVAFLNKDAENELTAHVLTDGQEFKLPDVTDYLFDKQGDNLAIERKYSVGGKQVVEVVLLNVQARKKKTIWKGADVSGVVFNHSGGQLAFIGRDSTEGGRSVYFYDAAREDHAVILVSSGRIDDSLKMEVVNGQLFFSERDDRVLFSMTKIRKEKGKRPLGTTDVYVWNYKDKYLQTEQRTDPLGYAELMNPSEFLYCVDLASGHITRVQRAGDLIRSLPEFEDNILMTRTEGGAVLNTVVSLWLTSTSTGKSDSIGASHTMWEEALSPDGRFVTWFDGDSLVYWCYDVLNHTKRSISDWIPTLLYDDQAVKIGRRRAAFGIPAWLEKDKAFLIYDKYDIWQVDPTGIKPPRCITHGNGRSSKIVFGLVNTDARNGFEAELHTALFASKERLLLTGFNEITKDNGLWEINNLSKSDLIEKCYGPYCYYISRVGDIGYVEYPRWKSFPRKAKNADVYLICRMSAEEYPNWYVSKGLDDFRQLTDLHPEQNYNWLKTRLMTWRTLDGLNSQGILYQPENLDSTKKYPLIFDYYEKRSDELHEYLAPDFSSARIDIPYFVSNGYVVFVPDIYYKQGHNGAGVYNTVIAAARHLPKTYPWLDSSRFGLQGHSFGGWETNYLITHSTMFRAACEAAGVSDEVSAYDELQDGRGAGRQELYEVSSQGSPYGIGVTPWTRPDLYMENSPIFHVQNVVTPLLMMQGNADPAVPFSQSVELFQAMRRAGKKVWLLEYDKATHVLYKEKDALDFTIRVKQFFDYYLKSGIPPCWMTKGVSAADRGFDKGLKLDVSGDEP